MTAFTEDTTFRAITPAQRRIIALVSDSAIRTVTMDAPGQRKSVDRDDADAVDYIGACIARGYAPPMIAATRKAFEILNGRERSGAFK